MVGARTVKLERRLELTLKYHLEVVSYHFPEMPEKMVNRRYQKSHVYLLYGF